MPYSDKNSKDSVWEYLVNQQYMTAVYSHVCEVQVQSAVWVNARAGVLICLFASIPSNRVNKSKRPVMSTNKAKVMMRTWSSLFPVSPYCQSVCQGVAYPMTYQNIKKRDPRCPKIVWKDKWGVMEGRVLMRRRRHGDNQGPSMARSGSAHTITPSLSEAL